ncbi:MAG TPA: flagellar basal body-associated FliL family protein [Lacipirellulaceae bacterium]|nr:flagellar basal body-associated FliL family protein [Lacipirellulaceae bacterium]
MSDAAVEQHEPANSEDAPKKKGKGLMRIVKAIAFISVIVVVQVVVASMLAPSAKDTDKLAHELVAASSGKSATEHEEAPKPGAAEAANEQELHEVELGTFNVTRFNPGTNTTLAIDFEVYGTVLADDAPEFEKRFEKSKARIKEQITMTMHGAEATDLTDAGLGLIKRQILEKTNRALGQPVLKEVLFSKFNFVER